jgi:L-amino acid N-acyltransferase YncA
MSGAETPLTIRRAVRGDSRALSAIFNQGVEDRVATFETTPATEVDANRWIDEQLVLVASLDDSVVAWAKAGPYSDAHSYYDGVHEATLYVERGARRAGIGRALLAALADAAGDAGAHKLVGKIFTSNEASIALVRSLGWLEVGVHVRHGRLDGDWKDVLVVEKLLNP